jgi:D-glycero-alpha-D-manno-heptose-7-phosphate kinase
VKRIEARAPVRLDLAGGWTDVPPYTHDHGGEVVNVAINIHASAILTISDQGHLKVEYSCEAPVGSGLGTTGAINVALMAAINGAENAEEAAYQFESLLGNTGGRQDQWAAKHGGFNHLIFIGDNVEPMPFEPPRSAKFWLHKHLIVANSGIPHVSGDLHDAIWARYAAGDEDIINGLMTIRLAARTMAQGLDQDRRNLVVEALNDVCKGVDLLDPALHDPFRKVVDPLLASRDVVGWKALGAGGGGCVALLAGPMGIEATKAACEAAGWDLIDWEIDDEGLVVNAS